MGCSVSEFSEEEKLGVQGIVDFYACDASLDEVYEVSNGVSLHISAMF